MLMYLRLLSDWITTIIATCVICIPLTFVLLQTIRLWIHRRAPRLVPHLRQQLEDGKRPLVVGFFHPYCNAGGGGERVLWVAVRALQKRYPHVRCVIYTGDTEATGDEILQRARQRFNIILPRSSPSDVHFVFLRRRLWVEASRYPYFTLLGQSLGSLVLGFEALLSYVPDIYFDTMGYAFTIPLFRYFGGCLTACYVHYPTISTDMLERVALRLAAHNNARFVSRSPMLSSLKLTYYRLFAWAYGIVGRRCHLVLVNSSWTYAHIVSLWQARDRTHIIYPPCDVAEFTSVPLVDESSTRSVHTIVSVGQFRPEKDHRLQMEAFQKFQAALPAEKRSEYQLLLVGGCRNKEDSDRVDALKNYAEELGITKHVEFHLNVPFHELKRFLVEADIGLHTMWNEHFGIGVVECMAAGTIVLAHDSGGPKLDIVTDHNGQKTGFLASSADTYAAAMLDIFCLNKEEKLEIRTNARKSVQRFSDAEFEANFISTTQSLFN